MEAATGLGQYALNGGWIVLYMAGAVIIGVSIFSPLVRRVSALPIGEGGTALVVVITLAYAWAAEAIGRMAAITRSFIYIWVIGWTVSIPSIRGMPGFEPVAIIILSALRTWRLTRM